nr:hypothetical protein [Tanacetum cinerariifolium]
VTWGQRLRGNKPPTDMEPINLIVANPLGTGANDSTSFLWKEKKGKSQTVTSTLPQSQRPDASRALSKKIQKHKSKKPPTKTKVTPPKPMEVFDQYHSVSSGTVPDPQDLKRNKQLASFISIRKLTPTNKELREPWLIRSLLFIIGEDVPYIQAVKPGQSVVESPIVNEELVEIDDKSGGIDVHEPVASIESNQLFDDVDSLFKKVINARPDLVGRVDELRTKLVQTLTSMLFPKKPKLTTRPPPFDDSRKPDDSKGDENNCYYQESQPASLQHLLNALEPEQILANFG